MWDVFISHASDDKEAVARPLARALISARLHVWYDEFTLFVGDSLRRSIDKGLRESRYGVVILSPSFFAKEWPIQELDGIISVEIDRASKVVLPVWHNVQREDIQRYSPILASKLGISTAIGIEEVAARIVMSIQAQGTEVASAIQEVTKPKPTNVKIDKNLNMRRSLATINLTLRVDHEITIEQKPAFPLGIHLYIAVDGRVVVRELARLGILPGTIKYRFTIEDVNCEAHMRGGLGIYFVDILIGGQEIASIF